MNLFTPFRPDNFTDHTGLLHTTPRTNLWETYHRVAKRNDEYRASLNNKGQIGKVNADAVNNYYELEMMKNENR